MACQTPIREVESTIEIHTPAASIAQEANVVGDDFVVGSTGMISIPVLEYLSNRSLINAVLPAYHIPMTGDVYYLLLSGKLLCLYLVNRYHGRAGSVLVGNIPLLNASEVGM